MKIDLRKDRGILSSSSFQANSNVPDNDFDLSEEERIAQVMRRRLSSAAVSQDDEDAELDSDFQPERTKQSKTKSKARSSSKRNPVREFILLILLILTTLYYLYDKGLLQPYSTMVVSYWKQILGIEQVQPATDSQIVEDGVLPDDIFNALMPVTEDLAALADSIEETTLAAALTQGDDSLFVDDTANTYTEISETPIALSDQDIIILNNRSLLLMLIDLVGMIPEDLGETNLFLKRDALTISAPRGGKWVENTKKILDKFVFGSFNEDYSSGKGRVSSKFEIIMAAEPDFVAQDLDALRLLDVLAHPFNDYLEQIVVDLSRGVNDNPARFSYSGTTREIQYVLSSWAESRVNMRIISADIRIKGNKVFITLDVEFFDYQL